jgi:DNA-binding CsgD family transcriptional regulator
MLRPDSTHHQLSAIWRELLAEAALPQGLASAQPRLCEFFRASAARILRRVPAATCNRAAGSVHTFDRNARESWSRQVLEDQQAGHGACIVLRRTASHADVLAIVREQPAFEEAEIAWLELLAPQFQIAHDLADTLGTPFPSIQAAGQMVRLLPVPCLLIDQTGRCLERNRGFDKALQVLHGSLQNGRVAFRDPFLQDSWRQALAEGHDTWQSQALLANAASGSQWKVHVVPTPCRNSVAGSPPQRLLFVLFEKVAVAATPTRSVPSSRPLTKAELEVLASLLLGHTAKVIARTRGASVNTVRSQITSILGKTGHHNQKQLIASFSASAFELASTHESDDA